MAKYFGVIGFAPELKETKPGVWEEVITEREYSGDVIRNTRRLQSVQTLNDNINISNEISIIADPYVMNHIYDIRYATYMGQKWKVSNVEVQYPRLNLSLGGLYIDA